MARQKPPRNRATMPNMPPTSSYRTPITTDDKGSTMNDRSQPNMKALGSLGGTAKAANVTAKLDAIVNGLPPLDSVEACKKSLHAIRDAAMRGLIGGSQAGAAVRACEAWLKAYQAELDRNRMREMEKQIASLEEQLSRRASVRRVG